MQRIPLIAAATAAAPALVASGVAGLFEEEPAMAIAFWLTLAIPMIALVVATTLHLVRERSPRGVGSALAATALVSAGALGVSAMAWFPAAKAACGGRYECPF